MKRRTFLISMSTMLCAGRVSGSEGVVDFGSFKDRLVPHHHTIVMKSALQHREALKEWARKKGRGAARAEDGLSYLGTLVGSQKETAGTLALVLRKLPQVKAAMTKGSSRVTRAAKQEVAAIEQQLDAAQSVDDMIQTLEQEQKRRTKKGQKDPLALITSAAAEMLKDGKQHGLYVASSRGGLLRGAREVKDMAKADAVGGVGWGLKCFYVGGPVGGLEGLVVGGLIASFAWCVGDVLFD